MKSIKTISIKCETKDFLKLEDMTVMQGGLKERNDTDYDKIKKSILTYSFSFPFFIWKSGKTNYLIDGTGRHSCLLRMQEEGYIIPELPVVYIQCKNKADAKQKLLRLNSQYGRMTKESVLTFAEDIELNFEEIALPDTVIDFTNENNVDLNAFFEAGQDTAQNEETGMKVVEITVYEVQLQELETLLKDKNYTYKVK